MAPRVKLAVILAAGMGTRLRDTGHMVPKGFLQFGELPIIEESILKLKAAGIERVIIVTGHVAEKYQELAAKNSTLVETVHSPKFADSGSMYSLYMARELIDEDFLLLESDLVFEKRALETLQNFDHDNCVLLSGPTNAGDEVYVMGRDGLLLAMSKNPADKTDLAGELVGISLISTELFAAMLKSAEAQFKTTLHVSYEDNCIVAAAGEMPVNIFTITDLLWGEVDDAAHLTRVTQDIYPAILARDGQV